MKIRFIAGLVVAALLGVALRAEFPLKARGEPELSIAKQGESSIPIILAPDAPPQTKKAAETLALYIEKVVGARSPIIDAPPAETPNSAIWVGYHPKLAALFPNTDFEFKHPEEIFIKATKRHLFIGGRERWDPTQMMFLGRNGVINGYQEEYGTANAVYTFIQQYLGVRWFWPGPSGEDIIRKESLSFAPFEFRYHPQFRARALFRLSSLGDERGVSGEWTRLQRLQLDSLKVVAGHAFSDWWERFHQTNPEFFALQPDGTRGLSAFFEGHPHRWPHLVKICLSNPAVWEQWLLDVDETLRKNPNQKVFNASENDSFHRGICVCDNCRAWDVPTSEQYEYTWKGLNESRGGLSDRYLRFWNILAQKLKERYPDKELYVQGMGYGFARMAPVREQCDERVIVLSVANISVAPPAIRTEHMEGLKGWGKVASIVWRPNLWTRAGKWGLPEVSISTQAENFRLLAESNGIGMIFDTVWEHWATFAPQYYLMAQLSWDPRLNADAVMKEYYQRGFGPAAGDIEQYWKNFERLMENPLGQPMGLSESFIARSARLLDMADEKVAGEAKIYRERIAFLRDGLAFTRKMVEFLKVRKEEVAEKLKSANSTDDPRVAAAWNEIERWVKDHPDAVNHRYTKSANVKVNLASERQTNLYLQYIQNIWIARPDIEKAQAVDLDLPAGEFQ